MPTAPSLEFFFGFLKCGIRVVLTPSGVESAKQSPRGSSLISLSLIHGFDLLIDRVRETVADRMTNGSIIQLYLV